MPLTHARAPAQNQSLAPPDYWVSEATAWNYKIASEEKTYKLHDDQATSIRMYAESLGEHVFYYKEQYTIRSNTPYRCTRAGRASQPYKAAVATCSATMLCVLQLLLRMQNVSATSASRERSRPVSQSLDKSCRGKICYA